MGRSRLLAALRARLPAWLLVVIVIVLRMREFFQQKRLTRVPTPTKRRSASGLSFAVPRPSASMAGPPALTLTQHLLSASSDQGLTEALLAISRASRAISMMMRRGLRSACSHLTEEAAQRAGDVDRLDLTAADIFIRELSVASVKTLWLSTHEARGHLLPGPEGDPAATPSSAAVAPSSSAAAPAAAGGRVQYHVTVDPLDGANNADAGVSVGSIFGLYRCAPGEGDDGRGRLRAGRELVAAGYAMYGAATQLVLSMGSGVHGFTLDPVGEFLLTRPHIRTPPRAPPAWSSHTLDQPRSTRRLLC